MKSLNDIDWDAWEPKDRATLLFVLRDGRILLIHKKRGLGKGKINGPGGRLDPGETPIDCAVRECEEELRIKPLDPVEMGTLRFQFRDGYSLHGTVFTAREFVGTPTETDEALPEWFDFADIPYERMWEDDRYWLPQMLAGQRFRGTFLFDDDRMLDREIEFETGD